MEGLQRLLTEGPGVVIDCDFEAMMSDGITGAEALIRAGKGTVTAEPQLAYFYSASGKAVKHGL